MNDLYSKYGLSDKGIIFITAPKRGMATDINADIVQTLTAKGQSNWTGTFISPDIDHLEKSKTIGSTQPVKIIMKNGEILMNNGKSITYPNKEDWVWNVENTDVQIRVRKLTPKECWRLMGFDDESFSRAEKVCSSSQLYKQAGNSIVVPVLEAIFRQML